MGIEDPIMLEPPSGSTLFLHCRLAVLLGPAVDLTAAELANGSPGSWPTMRWAKPSSSSLWEPTCQPAHVRGPSRHGQSRRCGWWQQLQSTSLQSIYGGALCRPLSAWDSPAEWALAGEAASC